MAVVYYRYRSEVNTFSVPVPGPTVSVGELKRLGHSRGRRGGESIEFYRSPACSDDDAHSRDGEGESIELYRSPACDDEYDDDAHPVPLHSTVIACRVPAGGRGETITADLHCRICGDVMADAVLVGSSSLTSKTTTTTMENHEAHRAALHYRHHERKRADLEDRRQEDRSFKRRCGSPRPEGGGARGVVSLL